MKLQTIKKFINKSNHRILIIMIMSVAAIIEISGLVTGGIIWHQQPRFCAMCHMPMNNYVQNYFGGDTSLLITKELLRIKLVILLLCQA
jgi:hypothetical protein